MDYVDNHLDSAQKQTFAAIKKVYGNLHYGFEHGHFITEVEHQKVGEEFLNYSFSEKTLPNLKSQMHTTMKVNILKIFHSLLFYFMMIFRSMNTTGDNVLSRQEVIDVWGKLNRDEDKRFADEILRFSDINNPNYSMSQADHMKRIELHFKDGVLKAKPGEIDEILKKLRNENTLVEAVANRHTAFMGQWNRLFDLLYKMSPDPRYKTNVHMSDSILKQITSFLSDNYKGFSRTCKHIKDLIETSH